MFKAIYSLVSTLAIQLSPDFCPHSLLELVVGTLDRAFPAGVSHCNLAHAPAAHLAIRIADAISAKANAMPSAGW
jgi:hypothetical protein